MAQIIVHPGLLRRYSSGDVVRYFERIGYTLSNTSARNVEARPLFRRSSVVTSIFDFARRPQ